MARITENLNGLIVPDPRFSVANIDTARSTHTEAGPMPGVPVADNAASTLRPIVSGNQTAEVRGAAVRAGGVSDVEFAFKMSTEGANDWRGWQSPSAPVWAERIATAGTGALIRSFDCATDPNTQDVYVAYINNLGTLNVVRWLASAWTSTDVQVAATISWEGVTAKACAIRIQPTGRIVVRAGCASYFSDDSGASWSVYAAGAFANLASNPDGALYLRVFEAGGQLGALWVENAAGNVGQAASIDQGQTWISVETQSAFAKYIDAAEMPDGSAQIIYSDASGSVKTIKMTSAFQALSDLSSGALTVKTAGTDTYPACAIACDPDGRLYAYARSSDEEIHAERLISGTWYAYSTGLINTGSGQLLPDTIAATTTGSGVALIHDMAPADDQTAGKPLVLRMTLAGGWSTLVADHNGNRLTSPGFENADAIHYQPFAAPNTGGAWALVAGSSGSAVAGDDYLTFSSANRIYEKVFSTTDTGITAQWQMEVVTAATSGTNYQPGVEIQEYAGGHKARVIYRTNSVEVYDVGGSATVITATIDTTAKRIYHLHITPAGVCVFAHRLPGATVWTIAGSVTLAGGGAGTHTANYIRFGHSGSGTIRQSRWYWVQARSYADLSSGQLFWVYGQGDLVGRPLSSLPTPIPVVGSTASHAYIHAEGGDAPDDALFTIAPDYRFPLSASFPDVSPSPSTGWRSTSTAEQLISFDLGSATTSATTIGKAIAVYLDGCNFRTAYLESSANGSAWTTRSTIDLASQMGAASPLSYSLTGDVLTVNTGSAEADRYLYGETLIGSHVELGGTKSRKIVSNLSGQWGDTGTTARPVLRLEAVDGTEGATGQLRIVSKRGAAFVFAASLTAARYWRIRIPASQPVANLGADPQNEYRIGVLAIGEFLAWGSESGSGWNEQSAPNYTESINRRGTVKRTARGPSPRTWSFVFDSADRFIDTNNTTPDYISNDGSGLPLASRGEVYEQLRAAFARTGAGAVPVVACRYVPAASGVVTWPEVFCYGHISGRLQLDQVSGDSDYTGQQVIRAGAVAIDEAI